MRLREATCDVTLKVEKKEKNESNGARRCSIYNVMLNDGVFAT